MPTYAYLMITNGKRTCGIVSADTAADALTRTLGSAPAAYGVTYANVYRPGDDANHEWFMHPSTRPQDHTPLR